MIHVYKTSREFVLDKPEDGVIYITCFYNCKKTEYFGIAVGIAGEQYIRGMFPDNENALLFAKALERRQLDKQATQDESDLFG